MSPPLSPLWSARGVAVVGASERPGALGRLPLEFLQRYGFDGDLWPIRPDGATVLGLPSYASIRDCPGEADLAMIMVAAERVADAIRDCAAAGVPVAVVCSSGFAEAGEEGAARQREIVRLAREGDVRLVGPNCIGSVGVAGHQVTSFSPFFSGKHTRLVDGPLGFVSQSGALGYGAVSLAYERGLGLRWVVNTGNEADVGALEVMTAIAGEPGCRGILGYVETLSDAEQLRALAATGTPTAILKAGRSDAGARAAASHTGALAAGDRVVDAALRQYGIVRALDVDELLDIGDAFAQPRRPAGPRVAVVTTSGGSGILAADAVSDHGLELAELAATTQDALTRIVPAFGATDNPVDVTATVMRDPALFDRALDALVDDPGVDLVVACFCVLTGSQADDVVAGLSRVADRSGKPVLAVRTGADHLAPEAGERLRAAGIPVYSTPNRAVRAAAALWQVAAHPSVVSQPSQYYGEPQPDKSGDAPAAGADEHAVKQLLADAGLPVPTGRLVDGPEQAEQAVRDVGGRAVLKAVVPGMTHKTEAGGVVVGVTPEQAADVYARLAALGGDVLVEELVDGGVEVLAGVTGSPLGPVLTLGPGGILTELLDDVALRLLPVTREEVERMVDETRLGRLLAGTRGAEPADRAALVDLLLRLADVVAGWPGGFELDLNPVAALPTGQGVRILDAAYVAPAAPEGSDD